MQQIGSLAFGKIEASIEGPQLDLPFTPLGIDVGLKRMLAEDRSHGPCYDGIAAIKYGVLGGSDAIAEIAVALSLQEHVHGGSPHFQNALQGPSFEAIQAGPFSDGLANEVGEILGQFPERNSLANLRRRCDHHDTASMRVVLQPIA